MGQVRWASWTVAIAAVLATAGSLAVAQELRGITSDKPAAIVIYPMVTLDSVAGVDTTIRLANTDPQNPVDAHCFYLDANSHCSGGTNHGTICTSNPAVCGAGICVPGWLEIDFRIRLTADQPIEWLASDGLADSDLPLPRGYCERNPFRICATDDQCNPFPGGSCTQSNTGTRIPPVPEDPFVGELKCIVIDQDGVPIPSDVLKGEALVVTSTDSNLDVASYNAIGVRSTGQSTGAANELILGAGPEAEYAGCPNYLLLDHLFEGVNDPIPGSNSTIQTNLVLVPCSEDLLRQIPGRAVAQYLVFNEFEQRFSTSRAVDCFANTRLCNIDTPNCSRSIFHAGVSGTVAGQTRINPIGAGTERPPRIPSGLLGVAFQSHVGSETTSSAGYHLQMQGDRAEPDVITIP